jgi:hypothetical protein
MYTGTSAIEYLRRRQPSSWALLKMAAAQGLVVIDEDTDSITATNRLLLTYPGLHDVISMIVDSYAERTYDNRAHFRALLEAPPKEEPHEAPVSAFL